MPCCTVAAKKDNIIPIFLRQLLQKDTHTGSIAIRHDKKVPITRQRFHCSVSVTILTNMVAGHTGTDPFPAPAVFRSVDPAKSGFILEHKADFLVAVDKLKFLYCGVNFFEAAISSSP